MKHIAHKIPRRLVTISFALLLFAPGAARAAECPESSPEDATERRKLAKEWFSAAETAETGGNDVEATRDYACSYKMVAHPFTAFNLARVSERSGDNDLALKMYKAYLALKPDAKDRDEVKGKIKALEEKMASGTSPAPADNTATATPTPPEEPAPEPAPDVLTPPPEPKPAEIVQKPAEPEPEPQTRSHTTEWIVGGVTAAALVGGVVTNLIARSQMSACQADANNGNDKTALSECNAAKPMAYSSYLLFGVAGAGIALDAVLILLHRHSEDSSGGDDSSVGFMVLPGGGGVSARGRF